MPDPNIPKILTLTTALMFSTFSTKWSTKVYTSKAPPAVMELDWRGVE